MMRPIRADLGIPRQPVIRPRCRDRHEHDAPVIRNEVVTELSELITTTQWSTDLTRPSPAPTPRHAAATTADRRFQPRHERPGERGRTGFTDDTRQRRLPNSRIDLRASRQRPESRSRLSPTAQSLVPQAESPVLPTARAANAGRRLFAGLRRLAARTQRVHRRVHHRPNPGRAVHRNVGIEQDFRSLPWTRLDSRSLPPARW